jgi:hypothetical protein
VFLIDWGYQFSGQLLSLAGAHRQAFTTGATTMTASAKWRRPGLDNKPYERAKAPKKVLPVLTIFALYAIF